jgi:hypothetical protein
MSNADASLGLALVGVYGAMADAARGSAPAHGMSKWRPGLLACGVTVAE